MNAYEFNRSTDPNDLVNKVYALEQRLRALETSTLDVNKLSEITSTAGNLVDGDLSLELKPTYSSVYRFNGMSQDSGTYGETLWSPFVLFDAGTFTRQRLFRFIMTGYIIQNSGTSRTITPGVLFEPDRLILSSGTSITVTDSAAWRGFRYMVDIFQAPMLGDNIQMDETFILERTSSDSPQHFSASSIIALAPDEITGVELAITLSATDGRFRAFGDHLTMDMLEVTDKWIENPIGNQGDYYVFRSQNCIDSTMFSNNATTNYGSAVNIHIGESNAAASILRPLIRFDDLANIPTNTIIAVVNIYLVVNGDLATNAGTIDVYRCLRNWTETGVTWNTYDGSNAWGTAGCGNTSTDYEGAVLWGSASTTAAEAVGTIIKIALNANGVAEFQKWIDGTNPNYGLLFKMTLENNDAYYFHSSDSTTTVARPMIEVIGSLP